MGASVNTDEASLACPLPTSCYVAWFLTGHEYRFVAWGLGTSAQGDLQASFCSDVKVNGSLPQAYRGKTTKASDSPGMKI